VIAAVLAAAPSLESTWVPGARHFDVVLAVNVAATLYPCDWWVAGDPEAFDRFAPIAPPARGVVTDALNYRRASWWKSTPGQVRRWCDFRAPFGSGQWHTSGPVAVGFAAMTLSASEVHCYGMDLAGTFDLDGTPSCSAGGADHRWRTEAAELAAIVAATRVRVVRHLAGGSEAVIVPPPPEPPRNVRQCRWCGRLAMRDIKPAGSRCDRCGHRSA